VWTSQSGSGAALGRLKSEGVHTVVCLVIKTLRCHRRYKPPGFLSGDLNLLAELPAGFSRSGVPEGAIAGDLKKRIAFEARKIERKTESEAYNSPLGWLETSCTNELNLISPRTSLAQDWHWCNRFSIVMILRF